MKRLYIFIVAVFALFLGMIMCVEGKASDVDAVYYEVLHEQGKAQKSEYITRGEFLSVLMKIFDYTQEIYPSTFEDVQATDWTYKYIANAENKSIAYGDKSGNFLPDEYITVEQAITFISRAYKIKSSTELKVNLEEIKPSEYSKNYIEFAVIYNLYPKRNGHMILASERLSTELALKLFEGYLELDEEKLTSIDFVYGYPKVVNEGKNYNIRVSIKVTKPCTVYYKITEATSTGGLLIPKKEDVNKHLAAVAKPNTELTVNINAEHGVRYNIYMIARDEDGFSSNVYTLKNVMPLPFNEGNGTEDNPYCIYSSYQLEQIRYYPDKHFKLCSDIAYNGVWRPIGDTENTDELFSGSIDGDGHSITGLYIKGTEGVGFVSCLYGGTIRNLNIEADVVGNSYVGVIAGEVQGGLIENCHASGIVTALGNIAGGIAGKNDGVIRNCVSAMYSVSSTSYSGGISGSNYGDILKCLSAASVVEADMYASGVSGLNFGGTIKDCVAACLEVNNLYTKNNGRITTNREYGNTFNNYVLEDMLCATDVYIDKDGKDGEEVSWSDLRGKSFYSDILKWNFNNTWTFDNSPDFVLPCIKSVSPPFLDEGVTIYSPIQISDSEQLKSINNNMGYHYILVKDITLPHTNTNKSNWRPIGDNLSDDDVYGGFTGSLDGNGHYIKGMKICIEQDISQYGLFGKISGGTVRNLKLLNVDIEGHDKVGTVAAVNYGTIENCSVSGKISAYSYDYKTMAGGICALNYVGIYSTDADIDIKIDASNSTVGGITSYNEGFINNCAYEGRVESDCVKSASTSVIGGIAGENYYGMVYNCSGGIEITSRSYTNYCGGIVGLVNLGEVYKCSSYGNMNIESLNGMSSYAYSGGICGMISGGLVMNSFSQNNITATADRIYSGGIVGFSENSSIQNTYAINWLKLVGNIYQTEDKSIYGGGIAGFCQACSVSGNVAINPSISSNGYYAPICAYFSEGFSDNNFCWDNIKSKAEVNEMCQTGASLSKNQILNKEFYFKAPLDGGKLGWINDENESVWESGIVKKYKLPTLSDVKNQDKFKIDFVK